MESRLAPRASRYVFSIFGPPALACLLRSPHVLLHCPPVDNQTNFVFQGGFTHIFVEEFETEEDRDYYTLKDPAHLAFANSLGAVVEKVQVVDFTPGVF